MSASDPQMKVRLPEALHSQIMQEAARNKRSMNAEITARLEASFAETDRYRKLLDQADETDRRLALLETYLRESEERRQARDQAKEG